MPEIHYAREALIRTEEFRAVLESSGLAARRPADDPDRLARMLQNANLIVTARDSTGKLIGIARSLTDFAYCCYLSDLAVDAALQGHGIGEKLIAETRRHAGPQAMCLLLSAPGAVGFYERIGMPRHERAFMYPAEG